MEDSKKTIEREIPGSSVNHFAFPWFEFGATTIQLLQEIGFQTATIGMAADRQGNQVGDDLMRVVRLNGDFVTALPGTGREGFFTIMTGKIMRRVKSGSQA